MPARVRKEIWTRIVCDLSRPGPTNTVWIWVEVNVASATKILKFKCLFLIIHNEYSGLLLPLLSLLFKFFNLTSMTRIHWIRTTTCLCCRWNLFLFPLLLVAHLDKASESTQRKKKTKRQEREVNNWPLSLCSNESKKVWSSWNENAVAQRCQCILFSVVFTPPTPRFGSYLSYS